MQRRIKTEPIVANICISYYVGEIYLYAEFYYDTAFTLVLGGTTVLPWNRGTSFSRYQYRRGHGTTVVPQYHEYRGTTVRHLPTNSHFREDFCAINTR